MKMDNLDFRYKKHRQYFEDNTKDYFSDVEKSEDLTTSQKFYLYKNGLKSLPTCKWCGLKTKWINEKKKFAEFCSSDCRKKGKNITNKKREATNQNRYNVTNISQDNSVKESKENTLLKKYGVKNPNQIEEIKAKRENTNLKKYGTKVPSQSKYIKEKVLSEWVKNNYEKLKDNYKILKNESNSITLKCHDCSCTQNQFSINKNQVNKLLNDGVPLCYNKRQRYTSKGEMQLKNYITSLINYNELLFNDKKLISPYELDIVIPNYKLAIEFNGLYYHSHKFLNDKYYHKRKTDLCKKAGYRLIHVWEDDWQYKTDIVKSLIKNAIGKTENKVYARKCSVLKVNPKEIKKFYKLNHIQGLNSFYELNFGLYYKTRLVACMSFSKRTRNISTSKNKEDVWELTRYATILNTNVIGGSSKLFNYFVKNYNPEKIISFSDSSMFTGDMYQKLGFQKVYETKPDYSYYKSDKRIHKSAFSKKRIQQKFKLDQSFVSNNTESEIMKKMGYEKIYSTDKIKWKMTNN